MPFTHDNRRMMTKRVHEVLLVSSLYDLYIMQEEGMLTDHISDQYALLHLTNAPAITRVATAEEALEKLNESHFDLVITGLRVGNSMNAFEMAKEIKARHKKIPVALMTSETARFEQLKRARESSDIDKVFLWHGDTRLFLALIKSFEDQANADHDCLIEHVRVIILVEDSPYFYSTYLPLIYTEILEQTRSLIAEGASDEDKLLRMGSRPKILMAETYEEAVELYTKFHSNLLGIISDIRYPKDGKLDPNAGFELTELVKKDNPDVPILLQSRDVEKAYRASAMGVEFADKNSPHLLEDLRSFVLDQFGFGDFVFFTPDGQEVGRARNLREMEKTLPDIPDEAVEFHASKNHFSNWLFARGEFELASRLKPMRMTDFDSVADARKALEDGLRSTRMAKRRARIARFSERDFDFSTPFVRFGEGSIGGKGRGIAFMSKMLARRDIAKRIIEHNVFIPQTAAIGTDEFDKFMRRNRLHHVALEESDDQVIAKTFLSAELPSKLIGELAAFLRLIDGPIAIRSSSLSEDSLSQPFAGLYSTYMIPNSSTDFKVRLRRFVRAIKMVYASTYFSNPKAFMESNGIAVESEKMAVIVQPVVGRQYGPHYYPDLAGIAQSHNFFPVGYLKPEDGVAQLVLGLGTMAARGEKSLRFCPRYPSILPQYGSARDWLRLSQREFMALNLECDINFLSGNEDTTLIKLNLDDAEKDGVLSKIAGVYSPEDNVIYDGLLREGKRVLTFKNILESGPLPSIITDMLDIGSQGMGCPVEIEFACNLGDAKTPSSFAFLQIRPLVTGGEADEVSIKDLEENSCIVIAERALGNGVFNEIKNIVYVKPDTFDIGATSEIAKEVGVINAEMIKKGESYILLGFGRWGTVNPQLGIPVSYAQISHAKVIGEISTHKLSVEPSQGTHFFHNIASCQIGYFSLNSDIDFIDWDWLAKQEAATELKYVKHIRTKSSTTTMVDGRSSRGAIMKPKNG
jgi:pyruvate phosphate dikinase-like enzyme